MSKKIILSSDPPARLEMRNVFAGYNGISILNDISFSIPHGSRVAVVGANGTGKSTLFKVLVGILPIFSGEVLIHGRPLGHHHDCVAYVPQREEVDWSFPVTVEGVVLMGRFNKYGWLKPPSEADRTAAFRAMQQMQITSLAKKSLSELSGGQQQRVFLARALAQEPHILLMDEPFSGVDATTQEATIHLLDDLKTKNVTVLVSTHDLKMARDSFELVILLRRRIIAFGSPHLVLTTDNLMEAFGGQALIMDDAVVVDQCCPGKEEIQS